MMKALGGIPVPLRTEEDIRNDYIRECAQAGELQYKIKEFAKALDTTNARIAEINKEFGEVLAAKPKEEPGAVPPQA